MKAISLRLNEVGRDLAMEELNYYLELMEAMRDVALLDVSQE